MASLENGRVFSLVSFMLCKTQGDMIFIKSVGRMSLANHTITPLQSTPIGQDRCTIAIIVIG
tara:strand:- start:188 stop:373 length:186 start_codon:yes stop_codon:yes gene_type:complete